MELMGAQEIGDLLGVSRQRAYAITQKESFPAPVAVLALGRIWLGSEVRAWAEADGRLLDDDDPA